MPSIAELEEITDVPVISISQQGLVTFVNQSFTDSYGWSKSDLLDKHLDIIIPTSLQEAHNVGLSRFLLTENPKLIGMPLSLKVRTKDGQELDAEHTIHAEKTDDHWNFCATIILMNES